MQANYNELFGDAKDHQNHRRQVRLWRPAALPADNDLLCLKETHCSTHTSSYQRQIYNVVGLPNCKTSPYVAWHCSTAEEATSQHALWLLWCRKWRVDQWQASWEPDITPLKEDDSQNVKTKAYKLLKTLLDNRSITYKQYLNLTNYSVKPPVWYSIPKIHKKNNPLRPIVSQINGPTYKLNQYIHELLLVAESEIPYLLKDTTAFLQLIEHHKDVTSNTILVTMDVVSLYTNIPHKEAIDYVTEHYEATLQRWHLYDTKVLKIKPEFLRQLLDLMLSNCTLEFNKEYYSQNYGTPMGAPASVRFIWRSSSLHEMTELGHVQGGWLLCKLSFYKLKYSLHPLNRVWSNSQNTKVNVH